ncbi:PEP-CTERM sorting domain-containing protein [Aestuariibacter sp. A3R04]|uniref:PEP-CTERM sorting domain-containing protein n=1 Tax=Aestuariibacter sp. A3R04 TaxID=2841571 RepID=UPI001C0820C8|nr:PEP-CTERM sorting domain-containing protein [Aestuariibacter sp. A3R04]MBU3020903.1 PEP-CTERM sorting domain-containing protein [Aestuariibacter sp. A3R04]
MKKSAIFGAFALLLSSQASASYITTVTGADMVGMEVTVTFSDMSVETMVWDVISMDPSLPFMEGYSGGVTGSSWSLVQQGDSISENPPATPGVLGAWTFTYDGMASGIESVYIDAWAGDVVFDTAEGDVSGNGSGAGRMFYSDDMNVSGAYDMNVEDELFGGLMLTGMNGTLLDTAGSFQFVTDTDISVPAPATLGIFAAALGFMGFNRRKKA